MCHLSLLSLLLWTGAEVTMLLWVLGRLDGSMSYAPRGTVQTGLCHEDLLREGRKTTRAGKVKVETRAGFQGKGSLEFLPWCDFGGLRKTGLGLRKDYLIPLEAMGPKPSFFLRTWRARAGVALWFSVSPQPPRTPDLPFACAGPTGCYRVGLLSSAVQLSCDKCACFSLTGIYQ